LFRRGQSFFGTHMAGLRHRRMARLLSAFPDMDSVRTMWDLCLAILGDVQARLDGHSYARHRCERMVWAAEREGLIRRLPTTMRSKAVPPERRHRGENAYRMLPEGLRWLGEQLSYERHLSRMEELKEITRAKRTARRTVATKAGSKHT
jgi:hypothetical protein